MSPSSRTVVLAALFVAIALAFAGTAGAGKRAATKVTIKAGGDVFGYVKSERKKCMDGRKVVVFKVIGEKGGGDDEKVGSDEAELSGTRAMWSIGQPGVKGHIYAKARKTDRCKAGTSKVVDAR